MSEDEKVLKFKPRSNGQRTPDGQFDERTSTESHLPKGGEVVRIDGPGHKVFEQKQNIPNPANDSYNLQQVADAKAKRQHFLDNFQITAQVWQYLHQHTEIRKLILELREKDERLWISRAPTGVGRYASDDSAVFEPLATLFNAKPAIEKSKVMSAFRSWLKNEFQSEGAFLPIIRDEPHGDLYIEWVKGT